MRRVRIVLLTIVVMAAIMVIFALPALADSYSDTTSSSVSAAAKKHKSNAHLLFLPPGANNKAGPTGDAFICIGGPPFVFSANCAFLSEGQPGGNQICNKPTIFTDATATPVNAPAFLCHTKKKHKRHHH